MARDGQQGLVLLMRKAGLLGGRLAERQEAAQLIAEGRDGRVLRRGGALNPSA